MADTLPDPTLDTDLHAVLDEVLKLPKENRAEILRFLKDYVVEQNSPSLLTAEQQAEVDRRLANPNRKTVPHEEVVASIRALLNG